MPRFIAVDDSPVELRLVQGLLNTFDDADVVTASNGVEALAKARDRRPDVVVSDLRMPEMDGLGLIDAMREQFPGVPIVIITSQGSEDLAVEALQQGAAGYLAKRWVARDLVSVVESLLEVSRRTECSARWDECVTVRELHLRLPNELELVGETVQRVQEMLGDSGLCDQRERIRVGVAVNEALVNAMIHGNLGISSELRERADGSYERLREARTNEAPYADRRVHVGIRMDDRRAVIEIRDEGLGFDTSNVPDPRDPENLLRCSGRGILMMQSFVDEVRFNATGNSVTLVKECGRHDEPSLGKSALLAVH